MKVEFIGGSADGLIQNMEPLEGNYVLTCGFSKEVYQRSPVFDSALNKYSDNQFIYRYVGTEVEIAFKEFEKAVNEAYRANYYSMKILDGLSSLIVWVAGIFTKKEE